MGFGSKETGDRPTDRDFSRRKFLGSTALGAVMASAGCSQITGGGGENEIRLASMVDTGLGVVAQDLKFVARGFVEFNPTVEVDGTTYEYNLAEYDSHCTGTDAVSAAEKAALQDNRRFFVGPLCSQATSALHEWLGNRNENERVLAVGNSSTEDATSEDMPYFYRVHGKASLRMPRIVRYLAEERDGGYDHIGKIAPSSDYGDTYTDPVINAAEELGLELSVERYPEESKDHRSQLTSLIESGMEVLLVTDHAQYQGISIRQARELGYDGPIQGNTNTPDGKTWEIAGGWPNMRDVEGTDLWDADNPPEKLGEILTWLEENHAEQTGPTYITMEAAGMCATIHHGLQEAGSTDPQDVAETLEDIEIDTGYYQETISFTEKHDINSVPVFIIRWKEGEELEVVGPAPENPLDTA